MGESQIVWNSPTGYSAALRRSAAATKSPVRDAGRRLRWWIVRSIIFATTAFALLDLYLLASGTHH